MGHDISVEDAKSSSMRIKNALSAWRKRYGIPSGKYPYMYRGQPEEAGWWDIAKGFFDNTAPRRSYEHGEELVDEFLRSEMSPAAFARNAGIPYATLAFWLRRRKVKELNVDPELFSVEA